MKKIFSLLCTIIFCCICLIGCKENGGGGFYVEPTQYDVSYVAVIDGEEASIPAGMYKQNGNYPKKYKEGVGATVDALQTYEANNVTYTFDGWFTDKACESAFVKITTSQTGAVKLYAKVQKTEKATRSITYKAVIDGVELSIPAGMYVSGGNYPEHYVETQTATVDALQTYEVDNITYTFEGWFADKDCQTPFTGITATHTGNLTVYAKVQKTVDNPEVYKNITYHALINGEPTNIPSVMYDTDASKYPTSYLVGAGATIGDLLSVGDYTFEGWFTDEGCTQAFTGITQSSDTDVALYAKIKQKVDVYSVIAYLAVIDGNLADIPAVMYDADSTKYPPTYLEGQSATVGDLLSTEKYAFEGWFIDLACMTEFEGISESTQGPITLYAKVKEIKQNVIVYKAVINGKVCDIPADYDLRNCATTYVPGETFTLKSLSKTQNYEFKGWYVKETCLPEDELAGYDASTKTYTTTIPVDTEGEIVLYVKLNRVFHSGYYQ